MYSSLSVATYFLPGFFDTALTFRKYWVNGPVSQQKYALLFFGMILTCYESVLRALIHYCMPDAKCFTSSAVGGQLTQMLMTHNIKYYWITVINTSRFCGPKGFFRFCFVLIEHQIIIDEDSRWDGWFHSLFSAHYCPDTTILVDWT